MTLTGRLCDIVCQWTLANALRVPPEFIFLSSYFFFILFLFNAQEERDEAYGNALAHSREVLALAGELGRADIPFVRGELDALAAKLKQRLLDKRGIPAAGASGGPLSIAAGRVTKRKAAAEAGGHGPDGRVGGQGPGAASTILDPQMPASRAEKRRALPWTQKGTGSRGGRGGTRGGRGRGGRGRGGGRGDIGAAAQGGAPPAAQSMASRMIQRLGVAAAAGAATFFGRSS